MSEQTDRTHRLERRFIDALDTLEAASPIGKGLHQNHVYEMALRLLKEPEGPGVLYRLAPRFDRAGVFAGSEWAQPTRLRPEFVAQSLHQRGLSLAIECLSEMRLLAIANRDYEHPDVTPEEAREFLESVLGLNLDLLFPGYTEASRIAHAEIPELMEGVQRLFQLLVKSLGSSGILASIVQDAERILRQRPIMVRQVKTTLATAAETIALHEGSNLDVRATVLINALYGPTQLARSVASLDEYRDRLQSLDEADLIGEAQASGDAMWATGLVAPQHAVLLRHLNEMHPDLVGHALRVESAGWGALGLYRPLVRELIDIAVHPETAQCIYGLANLLVAGSLFFRPMVPSLHRLIGMHIASNVGEELQQMMRRDAPFHQLSPRAILLAGTLSVLGQPLGIGQGDNPTCQSARAISLWAQVDSGYLLELLSQAARDDSITMHFEGQPLCSDALPMGMAGKLHTELDALSLVLVPHLDRIYAEMSRRVVERGDDPHRWINTEFHGWWVFRGFALAIDVATRAVADFDSFVRLFYASYHPDFCGEAELIYPQPIGIAATDHRGEYLGWHAISIQRVAPDPMGEIRVYFFNPNNDSGQNWGQGIVTSTEGQGELAGESSLPFHQFVSRLYLFHYNLREHGDPAAVPTEEVACVTELARASWGATFAWDE